MADTCPLCARIDQPSNQATIERFNNSNMVFDSGPHVTATVKCARCGGFRVLQGKYLERADEATLLRLSGLARAASNEGREQLHITNTNLAQLAARAPVPATKGAYYDRLLQLIAGRCRYLGRETTPFPLAELAAEAFLPTDACRSALQQVSSLVEAIEAHDVNRIRYRLSAQGWRRVDELTRQSPRGDRAFVAMWFDPQMADVYTYGFEAGLSECGYEKPFRVDDPKHQERADDADFKNRIDDRILAEIRRARFVVADATGARPSVYYEAGFADGLGTPVIWTCRASDAATMAFDTRQNEHILWKDPADLKAQLTAKIERRGWKRG